MNETFFKLEEDFEPIIRKALKEKEIKDMQQITTGWTNIVYEVKTNDGSYFFRFPRDEFWSRTIVKDCEFSNYIYNKTDFNTCKLCLMYDNGRPFSVHKKIEGTPLTDKMDELSDKEVENISADIAKFMYQLHNIQFEGEKIFKVNNIGLNLREFLNELLDKHVAKCDMQFWRFKDTVDSPKCLVHGDLNSSNILLDKNNKVSAIIDFGFAGFGNKYDDIARILSRPCHKNFKEGIIKAYETYENSQINENTLESKITEWNNIDKGYINYMRSIGIYE